MDLLTKERFEELVMKSVARMIPGNSMAVLDRYAYQGARRRVLVVERGMYCPVYDIGRTYDSYLHGESLDGILNNLQYMIGVSQSKPESVTAAARMSSFNSAREHLSLLLIDAKNDWHMPGSACRSRLDLVAIVRVDCGRWGRGRLFTEVSRQKMEEWGVNADACFNAALWNMAHSGFRLENIESFMMHPRGKWCRVKPTFAKGTAKPGLYVLTTRSAQFGASLLFSGDILACCAKKLGVTGNMAILPSSVNELILVPNVKKPSIQKLRGVVSAVNSKQRTQYAVLSDKVYVYNVKKGVVRIVD